MSSMSFENPEEVQWALLPKDIPTDNEDIWLRTNYGATSLLNAAAKGSKSTSARRAGMAQLLSQLSRANQAGGRPGGPRRNSYSPNRRKANNVKVPKGRHGHSRKGGKGLPGGVKLDALENAIGGQESGWGFKARNEDSGAAGYAQILPSNFVGPGGWDKEALGRDISLRQFMHHPKTQRRIARHKMKQYLHQYGLRGATQAWYGGPGAVGNNNISGGSGYPSTGEYADQVMRGIRRYIRKHRR